MGGERLGGTIGAVGSVVAVCAIAIFGYMSTMAAKRDHDDVARRLDAVNARLDEAGKTIAAVKQTAATPDAMHQDFLAIEAKVKTIGDMLADAKKAPSAPDAAAQTNAQVQQNREAISKLAASVGALHDSIAAQNKSLDTMSGSLAGVTRSLDTIKTGMTAASTKTNADVTASAGAIKAATVNAASTGGAPSADATTEQENNLVVVYLPAQMSPKGAAPGAPASLSVRFDKIGGTHPATDSASLIGDLKNIIKDRQGCIISVAGYADTLGTDNVNLAVSRERAEAVASKLRTAFAGQDVQVNKIAWGERQLKVWTPDGRSRKENRRVDIHVDCKN